MVKDGIFDFTFLFTAQTGSFYSKNFSFIYQNNKWKLSPAYDLLPSDGFNNNHTTTVNGKGKPTLEDCLEVARKTSFSNRKAKLIVDEVQAGVKK